jgi:hypothetical protein
MFIPDPDLYPSRIPDPKTAMKDIGKKKIVGLINFTNCGSESRTSEFR